MARRHWILIAVFALAGLLGYGLARTAKPEPPRREISTATKPARTVIPDEPMPTFRRGKRLPSQRFRDRAADDAGAIRGQRSLVFADRAALEDFLKRAGDRINILGRLDALNALQIGFSDYDELAGLLDGGEQEGFIFPVDTPPPGEGTAQAGAVGLGANLLEWLGITGDNSEWGAGVRVAVLDTGVTDSAAFKSAISRQALVEMLSDPALQNGHGTAVASMIIGNDSLTPGVAPGADIVSIRIANDLGQSDSFLLAKGIVAAVDSGAQIINISLGSFGDSALVRNAIEYARAAGSLIVSAAGNNGLERVTYPAANDGVIAVGAVDALGNHLDFSNSGKQVAIAAPGFGVNAAWTQNQAASVSGTSFSSPIVAGSIAALMSRPGEPKLSASQARDLLFSYLNDGGEAGADNALGGGMPDLGRVRNGSTPGIYDAAVASQRILPPDSLNPYGQVEVLIQNRGTEPLVNTAVRISTPAGVVNSNITSLPVNGVRTIRVPLPQVAGSTIRYDSKVSLSGGLIDAKPSNDRRVEKYVPAPAK